MITVVDTVRVRPADPQSEKSRWEKTKNRQIADFRKLLRDRYRYELIEDDSGRHAVAVALSLIAAASGPGASVRMDAFLDLMAPWMPSEERSARQETAVRECRNWSPKELGREMRLTFAEQHRLDLRGLIAADVTDEQRLAFYRDKKNHRDRERRCHKRLRAEPSPSAPERRARAIFELLPPAKPTDVSRLIAEVSDRPEFADMEASSLRKAVHRAIEYGVARGRFRTTIDERDPFQKLLIVRC